MNERPTVGSLFSGIGGLDLGLERVGFGVKWFCERDEFCQQVLSAHWPEVPIYPDVALVGEGTPSVDVITAGFPCQPVSVAGRRQAQEDSRWLWPDVERCVRILRPRGVLLENVTGLLTAGFDDVISGLAACGYDAEWDCIPAAAVGAPHLRDRVFVIATQGSEQRRTLAHGNDSRSRNEVRAGRDAVGDGGKALADAASVRSSGSRESVAPERSASCANRQAVEFIHGCFKGQWDAEPNVGRVAHGVPNRVDRLRALGNAVVPQVAEAVGRVLMDRIVSA